MNNRTHRKLLIVDGKVGFTGGVGIADSGRAMRRTRALARHAFPGRRPGGRADAGGVHGQLDQGDRRSAARRDYFPPLAPAGGSRAQMFSSSPDGGSESMHLMYLMAIAAAQRTIDLSSAYFVRTN